MQHPAAASPALLELHLACHAASQHLPRRARLERARLELAVRRVIQAAELGAIPLEPAGAGEIEERLRTLLHLARHARVDWSRIVEIVNREG